MGVNSLPKTVTRQRRSCDFNPGPSLTESSTLTTRLPSHSTLYMDGKVYGLIAMFFKNERLFKVRRPRGSHVNRTRSSAIAEGPRDASCQLKSCQLPRNSAQTTYTSPDQVDGMKLEI